MPVGFGPDLRPLLNRILDDLRLAQKAGAVEFSPPRQPGPLVGVRSELALGRQLGEPENPATQARDLMALMISLLVPRPLEEGEMLMGFPSPVRPVTPAFAELARKVVDPALKRLSRRLGTQKIHVGPPPKTDIEGWPTLYGFQVDPAWLRYASTLWGDAGASLLARTAGIPKHTIHKLFVAPGRPNIWLSRRLASRPGRGGRETFAHEISHHISSEALPMYRPGVPKSAAERPHPRLAEVAREYSPEYRSRWDRPEEALAEIISKWFTGELRPQHEPLVKAILRNSPVKFHRELAEAASGREALLQAAFSADPLRFPRWMYEKSAPPRTRMTKPSWEP